MADPYNLRRFLDAQERAFDTAMIELRGGSKKSHWMWFIFPQLSGLGHSPTARYYAISSIGEARAYLEHPVLGQRLRQSLEAILPWVERLSADRILGPLDALKLKSSLTLFDQVEPDGMFADALRAFYAGARDERTLALLNVER